MSKESVCFPPAGGMWFVGQAGACRRGEGGGGGGGQGPAQAVGLSSTEHKV